MEEALAKVGNWVVWEKAQLYKAQIATDIKTFFYHYEISTVKNWCLIQLNDLQT